MLTRGDYATEAARSRARSGSVEQRVSQDSEVSADRAEQADGGELAAIEVSALDLGVRGEIDIEHRAEADEEVIDGMEEQRREQVQRQPGRARVVGGVVPVNEADARPDRDLAQPDHVADARPE